MKGYNYIKKGFLNFILSALWKILHSMYFKMETMGGNKIHIDPNRIDIAFKKNVKAMFLCEEGGLLQLIECMNNGHDESILK